MNIEKEVKDIILSILNVEKLPYELTCISKLSEIGLDSIKLIEMIINLENKFEITFEDEELDIDIINNYRKIIEIIRSKYNSKVK